MVNAAANPPLRSEPMPNWFERVRNASNEKRDTAGDWGSRLHDALECALLNYQSSKWSFAKEGQLSGWVDPFFQWVDDMVAEVVWTEKVLTHPAGWYAGRADAHFILKDGRLALPDFKNQDFKGRSTPNWYTKEWTAQLAAYTRCSEFIKVENINSIACFSIVFDRTKPGMPAIREWTADELRDGWMIFYHALMFWKAFNNFYPDVDGNRKDPVKWRELEHLGAANNVLTAPNK